jgi:signal transduction histidine kinase
MTEGEGTSGEMGETGREAGLDRASVEQLLDKLLGRVHGVLDDQARLRLLLDAVAGLTADLGLDAVLARIVRIAGELVDARYAAMGVLNENPGPRLRTFVHHGISVAQAAEIGDLPTGHGLLGLIIDRPEPLRLHDIAAHPESYGFPAHHPPMRSFLGVPVRTRGQVFGNLYLTEKAGGADFSESDEEIVVALAAAAGVAIENARLYEQAQRREAWLAASAEITAQLAGSTDADAALLTVADRARGVAGADVAWIVAGDGPEFLTVRAVSGVPDIAMRGIRAVSLDPSLAREVVLTGEAITTDDIGHDPRALDVSTFEGWPALGPALVVPMRSSSGVQGALALAWRPENTAAFHAVDAALPGSFAEQAALALEVARVRESHERLVVLEDRDRIARDLHDLVIQRIFAVSLSLQGTARRSADADVSERIEEALDDLDATIKDIRRTIFALGALDTSADIQSEVTRLVERAGSALKFRPTLRIEGPVRSTVSPEVAPDLLAVLAEALSNASRHAEAGAIEVVLTASDGRVVLTVTDDGRGLPDDVQESGLGSMRDRAHRHDGSLVVESESQRGTSVEWSVPIA